MSILVDLSVIDPPLCEIKMSKLNKQHTVKQNIIKYLVEIFLKITQWWMIFKIIATVI